MNRSRLIFLKFALLTFALLPLAACASWDEARENTVEGMDIMGESFNSASNTLGNIPTKSEDYLRGTCPSIKLVDELGEYYEFSDFKHPTEPNLVTRVKVGKMGSTCSYTDRSVTVDMNLVFEGLLGPAADRSHENFFSYPFFVAITSPSNVIMARQVFSAPMTYAPGQSQQVHKENMRQIIPIARETDGPGYNILIGFQLNKQQLAYMKAIEKTRKKMASQEAKARAAAQKNAPDVMPLRDQPIRPQGAYQAPTSAGAPLAPVSVSPAPLSPSASR